MHLPLAPPLEPLASLLGTWQGEGEGHYPTIEAFKYVEEVTFSHVGKPFLAYQQRTRHGDTGFPLHAETGYWRMAGDRVEVVLAHPSGILESLEGSFDQGVVELSSRSVIGTATAKSVTELRRRFELDGDELRYDVWMAAVGQPLTHHLRAVLHRQR